MKYVYDWYVKRTGDSSFSLFREDVPTASIQSQVGSTDTSVGDEWYCVATPTDTDLSGPPTTSGTCMIVMGGSGPGAGGPPPEAGGPPPGAGGPPPGAMAMKRASAPLF